MSNPQAPPPYSEATGPGYPPQGGYPPPGGYPPQQGGYPPPPDGQFQGYPPQQGQVYNDPAYAPGTAPPSVGYVGTSPYPQGGVAPEPSSTTPMARGGDEEEGFTTGDMSTDKNIRRVFIRKVYTILTVQLLVTVGIVCLFFFHDGTRNFVQQNQGVYWASYAIFLATYIALACCPSVRRKFPGNFIALIVFTLALSYLAGTITSYYADGAGRSVLVCLAITAGVTIGVTIFSIQTRFDFTKCGGFLFVASWGLFLFGFIAIFTYSNILYTIYGWLAAVLFTMFLAYDTQLLIGGRRYQLSEEEYIFGAMNLYIDVVYLFLIILSLFGGGRGG
ncbi:protein lifeguard 2-like [Amphiura filiformis]|uniref:protein lifeguard 2-like n=1 Tax=Amphiura filiformis TaxID=82378 RepID=UPI003B20D7D7